MFQPCPIPLLALLLLLGGPLAAAQNLAPAPSPAPTGFALSTLRPALANVQTAIGNLNIPHWKTSSANRANAAQDVASMQKDLSTTLPGLMSQAETQQPSGPEALSPSFAVFRNIDALYDVLLRVTETAALTGPSKDANSLEEARAGLEDARSQLGAWLLQSIGAQDAQVVRLLATPPPPPAAAPPAPTKIVINDGPDSPKPRKKKPAKTPPPSPQ